MVHLTSAQLEKLQKLSNIKLDESRQQDFLKKLDPVVAKLEELGSVDTQSVSLHDDQSNTLRTLDTTFHGDKQKEIADKIMKNVEHEIINNSIVIKSVLS